jgi:hypothetical protein
MSQLSPTAAASGEDGTCKSLHSQILILTLGDPVRKLKGTCQKWQSKKYSSDREAYLPENDKGRRVNFQIVKVSIF